MLSPRAAGFTDTAQILAAPTSTPYVFTAIYQHKHTPASYLNTYHTPISIPAPS
jgi:hypothetical protein